MLKFIIKYFFIFLLFGNLFANEFNNNTTDSLILNFLSKNNINALSFAVSKNNKIVKANYYEYSKKESKILPIDSYRFRIASISKSFTATAIMQLVQKHKLNLTDKVFGGKCLKFSKNKSYCIKFQKGILENDFKTKYGNSIIPNNSNIYDIELIHLLEHTVGTWNRVKNFAGDPMAYKKNYTQKELISYVLKHTYNEVPNFFTNTRKIWLIPEVGTKFLYSNFGYSILGRIIEKISNVKYDEYIKQNILKELSINDMCLAGNESKNKQVKYYTEKGKKPYNDSIVKRFDSHGGWTANAEDLVKFGMQFNENIYPVKNKIGLNIASIKSIKTSSSKISKKKRYAKGFSIYLKNQKGWGHNGKIPGSLAYLRCNQNNDICYSAIINTSLDKKMSKKLKSLIKDIAYNNFWKIKTISLLNNEVLFSS